MSVGLQQVIFSEKEVSMGGGILKPLAFKDVLSLFRSSACARVSSLHHVHVGASRGLNDLEQSSKWQ